MLRRPPTVLTLTSEDVKAYEDRQEAEAFKDITMSTARQQAHHRHQQRGVQHNQLTRSMSGMDITGITTSSSEGGYEYDDDDGQIEGEVEYEEEEYDEEDEDEANQSYVPGRYVNMRPAQERARWRGLGGQHASGPSQNHEEDENEDQEEEDRQTIYRHSADEDDPFTGGNNNNHNNVLGEQGSIPGAEEEGDEEEDEDMVDAEESQQPTPPQPPTHQYQRAHRSRPFQHNPEPPPAPSRITTRSTRSGSREPASASSTAARNPAASSRSTTAPQASSHRRAHSGRATTTATAMGQHHEAVTPTPRVGGGRGATASRTAGASAFVTPDTRVTRSRDERITGAGTRGTARR